MNCEVKYRSGVFFFRKEGILAKVKPCQYTIYRRTRQTLYRYSPAAEFH